MNKHEPRPSSAQLNIKSAEARRLASELAELTGASLTDAVTEALRESLAQERRSRASPDGVADKLLALAREISKYPIKDHRTADEILGYDENGLPS